MHIYEKVFMDRAGLAANGPITIVAFGDSITHGAFEADVYDYENTYWNILKKKIQKQYPYIPVNVINAGIGGYKASNSYMRIDKHVLKHEPDLIIVCFGLNDVQNDLETYLHCLKIIFEKIQKKGIDCIFMTPNMLCTRVVEDVAPEHVKIAERLAEIQNSGRMDRYMQAAIRLCEEMGVTVCDCYSIWKQWSQTQDITMPLANRVNHPSREMHAFFADRLYETIFGQQPIGSASKDDGMFYGD